MPSAFCHICGQPWPMSDPGVRYLALDRVWRCWDETECTDRRARGEAELDLTIGAILADMEAEGWRF